MRRAFLIAALGVLAAILSGELARAQMRAGMGFTGRGGFAGRSSSMVFHGGFGVGHPGFSHSHVVVSFGSPFVFHRHFMRWPWWYTGYPVYSYPYYDPGYDRGYQVVQATQPDSYASEPDNERQELLRDIDRLSDKVDRLQSQIESRANAQNKNDPAPGLPVVLVFKDGRRQEVENYAIAGETLWVLTEQLAKKVPLAQLDLPATGRLNSERGVEFALPK